MKKKANIYDADDVERSKRLNFTPEERAARAEHKAEVLGTNLEKAKKKVPKKKKLRLQKELDPEKSGQAYGTECQCRRPLQTSSGRGGKRGHKSRPPDRTCV